MSGLSAADLARAAVIVDGWVGLMEIMVEEARVPASTVDLVPDVELARRLRAAAEAGPPSASLVAEVRSLWEAIGGPASAGAIHIVPDGDAGPGVPEAVTVTATSARDQQSLMLWGQLMSTYPPVVEAGLDVTVKAQVEPRRVVVHVKRTTT